MSITTTPDNGDVVDTFEQRAFDYGALDADAADFVRGQTAHIKTLYRGTIQNIVDIGQSLIDVKEMLEPGQFVDWLETEFS